jgi:hypothetical protein
MESVERRAISFLAERIFLAQISTTAGSSPQRLPAGSAVCIPNSSPPSHLGFVSLRSGSFRTRDERGGPAAFLIFRRTISFAPVRLLAPRASASSTFRPASRKHW